MFMLIYYIVETFEYCAQATDYNKKSHLNAWVSYSFPRAT